MAFRRLFWQLFPSYLVITLVALVVTGWVGIRFLEQFHYQQIEAGLAEQASLVQRAILGLDRGQDGEGLDSTVKDWASGSTTRVTVIDPTGRVVADSDRDPTTMDNHADRPEIAVALAGSVGVSKRYSHSLQKPMTYLAVPLRDGDSVALVVRTSLPETTIEAGVAGLRSRALLLVGGAFILAGVFSFFASRRFVRPIQRMRRAAERFAAGELDYRIPPTRAEEMASLADALNRMAGQLNDRIGDLEQRNREQAALFAGMVEGVVAVDAGERLISLNTAAGRLLGVDPERVVGQHLQEVIRNPAIQRFVQQSLATPAVIEGEIVLHDTEERYLQAHGARLHGLGAIVVMNDVTRLRRLENLRRDFVANVSHELRTPVTSIKGFLETLGDGALSDPEDASRFVAIATRQAERLHAIIEDLLALSRIEQEAERSEIELEVGPVYPVLDGAIRLCQMSAEERGVTLELSCPKDLTCLRNPTLLEQAVANLVDNGAKYSERGERVVVTATGDDRWVTIEVRDQGLGIPPEHHERLFERFYTVDKARSRRLGGTGLGLAIVKHIALAHGGRVTVDSEPLRGSVFSIQLVRDSTHVRGD